MILISKIQKMGRLKCHTQTFEDFYLSSSLIWLFGTNSPLKRHSKLWHSYLIVISCFFGFQYPSVALDCSLWLMRHTHASHTKNLHFSPVHEKNNHFRLLQAPFNNRNQQCHRTQNRNHFFSVRGFSLSATLLFRLSDIARFSEKKCTF